MGELKLDYIYIYRQMGSLVNVTCLWHGWLVGRQVGSLVNVTCQWHSWLVGWLVLSASQPHRVISVNNQWHSAHMLCTDVAELALQWGWEKGGGGGEVWVNWMFKTQHAGDIAYIKPSATDIAGLSLQRGRTQPTDVSLPCQRWSIPGCVGRPCGVLCWCQLQTDTGGMLLVTQNRKPTSSVYWSIIFFLFYQPITNNVCICRVCVCVCVCVMKWADPYSFVSALGATRWGAIIYYY